MHQDHTRSNQGHKDKCHPRRIVGKQHNHGDANEPHDRQRYLILRDTLARFARSQWHKAEGLAEILRPCLRSWVNAQLQSKERGQDAKDSPLGFVHGRVALMWPDVPDGALAPPPISAGIGAASLLDASGPNTCHSTRGLRRSCSISVIQSMAWYSATVTHTPKANIRASLSDIACPSLPHQCEAGDDATQARRPAVARARRGRAAKRKTERRGAVLWLACGAGRVRRLARGER